MSERVRQGKVRRVFPPPKQVSKPIYDKLFREKRNAIKTKFMTLPLSHQGRKNERGMGWTKPNSTQKSVAFLEPQGTFLANSFMLHSSHTHTHLLVGSTRLEYAGDSPRTECKVQRATESWTYTNTRALIGLHATSIESSLCGGWYLYGGILAVYLCRKIASIRNSQKACDGQRLDAPAR